MNTLFDVEQPVRPIVKHGATSEGSGLFLVPGGFETLRQGETEGELFTRMLKKLNLTPDDVDLSYNPLTGKIVGY